MSVGEDLGQLRSHGVGHAGLVGGAEQRAADGAAGQARSGRVGRRFSCGEPAAVDAAEREAGEVRHAAPTARPGSAPPVEQLAVGVGARLHHLAAAAAEQQPRRAVAAQEGRGRRIAHAQAAQQAVGGVGGAGDVAARQRHLVRRQRLQLLGHALGFDGLGHQALRQRGGVRHQRGHATAVMPKPAISEPARSPGAAARRMRGCQALVRLMCRRQVCSDGRGESLVGETGRAVVGWVTRAAGHARHRRSGPALDPVH